MARSTAPRAPAKFPGDEVGRPTPPFVPASGVTEIEAVQIPRTLSDFAAGVVNGNYALEAGLKPSDEAIVLEEGEDSPYSNMLVCREADKDNEGIVKLDELLHSDEVKKFIEETYTDGSVIPAF